MAAEPAAWEFVSFFALKPEAQAAWVQAFLTVLTFAGTVIFTLRQTRKEESRRQRMENAEARDIAVSIIDSMDEWNERLTSLLTMVKGRGVPLALNTYRQSQARLITQPILDLGSRLHLLADAAPYLQLAMYWHAKLHRRMTDFQWYEMYSATAGSPEHTPPAAHHRARELERELGDQLFKYADNVRLAHQAIHKLFF